MSNELQRIEPNGSSLAAPLAENEILERRGAQLDLEENMPDGLDMTTIIDLAKL